MKEQLLKFELKLKEVVLWFTFIFGLKFSKHFDNTCDHNLKQREIKIKLV